MMSFRPYEPQGDNPAAEWERRIHRAAFNERRILQSYGTLTINTGGGVVHKLKPDLFNGTIRTYKR